MPEIETSRLRLRQFTPDDFDDLFHLYSNPELMKYISGKARTKEETQDKLFSSINHWQQHGFGMWAIIHKDSDKMVGRCGLQFLDNTPEVELGYVLDKSYWNMGLTTEASQASLKYGFKEVNLERIVAIANSENIASVRVMQKVGMKYEKEAHYYNTDCLYYALTRETWQPDDSLYILRT